MPTGRDPPTATFVLIHGGGAGGSSWGLVAAELRGRGHDVVAVDLPSDDGSAGLSEYADAVVEAIGDRTHLVVVAHSLGAFTAPLVCARAPVDLARARGRDDPGAGRVRRRVVGPERL